jgi:V8-like Glu-specific endopeptidase
MRVAAFLLAVGMAGIFAQGVWASSPADRYRLQTGVGHEGPSEQEVLAEFHPESGDAQAAFVFPPDDRRPIGDTTQPLWRTISLVEAFDRFNHFQWSCSGVFLNDNVILTAAHCLYSSGNYTWSVKIFPGAAPDGPPFGFATGYTLAVPIGWADGPGKTDLTGQATLSPFDWGIIVLSSDAFHGRLAPYPVMADASDSFFASAKTMIGTAGFPGDKPLGSMWATDSFDYFVDDLYLYSRLDIFEGQSGSPVFAITDEAFFIFSVVSVGGPVANISVRFTPPVLAALKKYCTDLGCSIKTYTWVDSTPTPKASPTATRTPTSTPTTPPTPLPSAVHTYHAAAILLSKD